MRKSDKYKNSPVKLNWTEYYGQNTEIEGVSQYDVTDYLTDRLESLWYVYHVYRM